MAKKLYKSNTDSYIDGVCGGIAEYFGIDSTLVRLGLIVFCFMGGSGILAYIIAMCIMPEAPGGKKKKKKRKEEYYEEHDNYEEDEDEPYGNGPRPQ